MKVDLQRRDTYLAEQEDTKLKLGSLPGNAGALCSGGVRKRSRSTWQLKAASALFPSLYYEFGGGR